MADQALVVIRENVFTKIRHCQNAELAAMSDKRGAYARPEADLVNASGEIRVKSFRISLVDKNWLTGGERQAYGSAFERDRHTLFNARVSGRKIRHKSAQLIALAI